MSDKKEILKVQDVVGEQEAAKPRERTPLPPCPGPGYGWQMFGGKPAGWVKSGPVEPPSNCRRPINEVPIDWSLDDE